MDEGLYDQYVDAALEGRLHSPEGFMRRHGCDDRDLLAKLCLIYGQLAAGPLGERRSLEALPAHPESVAGFELLHTIGRGGFGEVYQARDPEGNVCAVKLMRFAVRNSAERRERFLREIDTVRRLEHPNIVRLLSGGEIDGLVYLALELVPGQTLRARVQEDPPSAGTAIRWCLELAGALQYVHQQGFLHRDIKPGNVMLRPDGRPVLLDFGLVMDTVADLATLTQGFVGTAAYAAPEQLQGLRSTVSERSDLYGLAATLYFSLTGRSPFGRQGERTALAPAAHQHPQLPAAVDALLARGLAEDPADRPASLQEFATELEDAWQLEGATQPLEVSRPSLEALLEDPEAFGRTQKTLPLPAGKPLLETLVPFQLQAPIGQGGNGVVYRAQQTRLDRPVAVKVVRDQAPEHWHCFVAEALLAGRLEHPNILPVYDLLQLREGGAQLAMKLVEGETWAERLEREDGNREAHLETLCSLCNAVAFAHSRGVVHNDLKPSNVLLGPFGEVLLCDWGVAVELHSESSLGIRSQASIDAPCGTPAYMSPELAAGDGGALSERSDVFQLGGILFRILTGRVPNDRARLLGYLEGTVVEPPELPDGVPEALGRLCRSALDPDPQRRPASALVFLEALKAWFLHRESEQICQAASEKLRACQAEAGEVRPARRDRLYERFSAVVAAFAAARDLHETEEARRGEQEARLAFASTAHRAGDFGLAETQLAQLPASYTASHPLRAELARGLEQRSRDRRARRLLRGVLLGGAALFLAVWAVVFVLRERDAERVRQSYQAANSYAESAMDGLFRVTANLGTELMEELGSTRSTRAVRELREAALISWRALLKTGHGTDTRQQLLMHARIATLILSLDSEATEADEQLSRAAELLAQLPQDPSQLEVRVEFLEHRADLLHARARWQELEEVAQQGLELATEMVSHRSPADIIYWRFHFLRARALSLEGRGDLEGAAQAVREALALLQSVPGMRPLNLFRESLRLALFLRHKGELAEARALVEPLIAEIEAWHQEREDSVMRREIVVEAYWTLSLVLEDDAEYQGMGAALRRAQEHSRKLRARFPEFPDYRRRFAGIAQTLAVLELRLGDSDESARQFAELEEVLAEFDPHIEEDRVLLVVSHAALQLRGLRQVASASQARAYLTQLEESRRQLQGLETLVVDARVMFELQLNLLQGCVDMARLLGRTAEVYEGLETICGLIEAQLVEQPHGPLKALLAGAWAEKASFLITQSALEEARSCVAVAVELLADAAPEDRRARLRAAIVLSTEALIFELESDLQRSRELLAEAQAVLEPLPETDPEVALSACDIALRQGRVAAEPAQGIALLEQMLAQLGRLDRGVEADRLTAAGCEELGWLVYESEPERALELAQRAAEIRLLQRDGGLGGIDAVRRCADFRMLRQAALQQLGRGDEALFEGSELYLDYLMVAASPDVRWSDHHDRMAFARYYAVELLQRGELEAADEVCERGLDAAERVIASPVADLSDYQHHTTLAVLRALIAEARGVEKVEFQAVAVEKARAALERFGPKPELRLDLARTLGDLATAQLAESPVEAQGAAAESAALFDLLGEPEQAAQARRVAARAQRALADE